MKLRPQGIALAVVLCCLSLIAFSNSALAAARYRVPEEQIRLAIDAGKKIRVLQLVPPSEHEIQNGGIWQRNTFYNAWVSGVKFPVLYLAEVGSDGRHRTDRSKMYMPYNFFDYQTDQVVLKDTQYVELMRGYNSPFIVSLEPIFSSIEKQVRQAKDEEIVLWNVNRNGAIPVFRTTLGEFFTDGCKRVRNCNIL